MEYKFKRAATRVSDNFYSLGINLSPYQQFFPSSCTFISRVFSHLCLYAYISAFARKHGCYYIDEEEDVGCQTFPREEAT